MYYVFLAALTTTECCQRTMPISFSPTSVQFKGEINDALPRKRHQKRHLDFCTAYLRSRGSGVRAPPGAPSSSVTYESGRSSISFNPNDFEKLPCIPIPREKTVTAHRTASRSALTMNPSRTQFYEPKLFFRGGSECTAAFQNHSD